MPMSRRRWKSNLRLLTHRPLVWGRAYRWPLLLLAVGGSVVGILTTTLQAGTATLIYLDLRVRTEGLDIEVAAAAQFAPSS